MADDNSGSNMATAALQIGAQIVSKIFGGMALRAKQAATENAALQQIVQGLDQAVAQVAQAVNSGQLTTQDARAELGSIWTWYWQAITPRIQPNRNGCSSGSGCPGDARSYRTTNGVPAGYCSGNIGASCCLGCGPIRLSLDNLDDVLAAGGGTATIAKVWGDHYGLQTRESYTVTFKPPTISSSLSSVPVVGGILSTLLPNGGQQQVLEAYTNTGATIPQAISPSSVNASVLSPMGNSNILLLGFGAVFFLIALLFVRK